MTEKKHRYSTTSVVLGAVTVIAVFVMLGVASESWQARLTLAHIAVKGNRLVSEQEILLRSGVTLGDNYETIDLESVSKRISQQPMIKSASAKRTLHEGISIDIIERIPVAAMTINDSLVFVDEDMRILPRHATHEALDLPIVSSCLANGKIDSVKLGGAVRLLAACEKTDARLLAMISEVTYSENIGYIAFTAEGGIPLRFGEGKTSESFRERAETFNLWKEQYMSSGTMPFVAYIDARFARQIVVKPGRDIAAQAEVIH